MPTRIDNLQPYILNEHVNDRKRGQVIVFSVHTNLVLVSYNVMIR